MAETVYTLTHDSLEAIHRDHQRLLHEVRNLKTMLRTFQAGDEYEALIVETDASGVTAATSSQLGSGSGTVQRISPSGGISAIGRTVDLYNISGTAVAANTLVKVSRVGPVLIVDVEDCS